MNNGYQQEERTLTYRDYLKQQDYSKGTVKSYLRYRELFLDWSDTKGYPPEAIDYKACIEYVKHLQFPKKGRTKSRSTVKHHIGALKVYFNYLVEENYRPTNPMQGINIRGVKRTLNHNLLEFIELENLYYSYPTDNIEFPNCPAVAYRNKVITGFMVYQGMNATALKSLRYEDVDVDRGTVYVPSTRKTNGRKLELRPQQIMPLVRFMEQHRETLQEKIKCYDNRLFPLKNDRFFITHWLFKELRRINHTVKNAKQLRASVITYWLSQYNIREVQYMAGHRYISSTERYVQDDLESLHQFIEELHPIS